MGYVTLIGRLRAITEKFQNWVKNRAQKWGAPIVEAPRGRGDELVEPYFRGARPDQVVVTLKAREPARIMIAIGNKQDNRWHLQIAQRWVQQYNRNRSKLECVLSIEPANRFITSI